MTITEQCTSSTCYSESQSTIPYSAYSEHTGAFGSAAAHPNEQPLREYPPRNSDRNAGVVTVGVGREREESTGTPSGRQPGGKSAQAVKEERRREVAAAATMVAERDKPVPKRQAPRPPARKEASTNSAAKAKPVPTALATDTPPIAQQLTTKAPHRCPAPTKPTLDTTATTANTTPTAEATRRPPPTTPKPAKNTLTAPKTAHLFAPITCGTPATTATSAAAVVTEITTHLMTKAAINVAETAPAIDKTPKPAKPHLYLPPAPVTNGQATSVSVPAIQATVGISARSLAATEEVIATDSTPKPEKPLNKLPKSTPMQLLSAALAEKLVRAPTPATKPAKATTDTTPTPATKPKLATKPKPPTKPKPSATPQERAGPEVESKAEKLATITTQPPKSGGDKHTSTQPKPTVMVGKNVKVTKNSVEAKPSSQTSRAKENKASKAKNKKIKFSPKKPPNFGVTNAMDNSVYDNREVRVLDNPVYDVQESILKQAQLKAKESRENRESRVYDLPIHDYDSADNPTGDQIRELTHSYEDPNELPSLAGTDKRAAQAKTKLIKHHQYDSADLPAPHGDAGKKSGLILNVSAAIEDGNAYELPKPLSNSRDNNAGVPSQPMCYLEPIVTRGSKSKPLSSSSSSSSSSSTAPNSVSHRVKNSLHYAVSALEPNQQAAPRHSSKVSKNHDSPETHVYTTLDPPGTAKVQQEPQTQRGLGSDGSGKMAEEHSSVEDHPYAVLECYGTAEANAKDRTEVSQRQQSL